MASRFFVGGGSSTNWSATGNTNWSATSGGANNDSVPVDLGATHSTGIGIRVTAAVADNDTTALAANAIIGNILYK